MRRPSARARRTSPGAPGDASRRRTARSGSLAKTETAARVRTTSEGPEAPARRCWRPRRHDSACRRVTRSVATRVLGSVLVLARLALLEGSGGPGRPHLDAARERLALPVEDEVGRDAGDQERQDHGPEEVVATVED